MIKSEIANHIRSKFNVSEKIVSHAVNHVFETMSKHLTKNGRVEIRGFGTFDLRYRQKRNAHNPKTRDRMVVEAKYMPHFKPGKSLREKVNASREQFPLATNETPEEN